MKTKTLLTRDEGQALETLRNELIFKPELVSARYAHVPTIDVVEALRGEGYKVTELRVGRKTNEASWGTQTHSVRLRHVDQQELQGQFPELVLRTAFDGSSSFVLSLGFYRLVCSNGLVVGETVGKHRVRHVGNAAELVVAAASDLVRRLPIAMESVRRMQGVKLTDDLQGALLKEAHALLSVETDTRYLLSPNRHADRQEASLWTLYNTIQERGVHGLYDVKRIEAASPVSPVTSTWVKARAIKSIPRLEAYNAGLFDAAAKLAA
jgi:hypothetical protein